MGSVLRNVRRTVLPVKLGVTMDMQRMGEKLSGLWQQAGDGDTFALIGSRTKDNGLLDDAGRLTRKNGTSYKVLKGIYSYDDGTQVCVDMAIVFRASKEDILRIAKRHDWESVICKDGDFFGVLKNDGFVLYEFVSDPEDMPPEDIWAFGSSVAYAAGMDRDRKSVFKIECYVPARRGHSFESIPHTLSPVGEWEFGNTCDAE